MRAPQAADVTLRIQASRARSQIAILIKQNLSRSAKAQAWPLVLVDKYRGASQPGAYLARRLHGGRMMPASQPICRSEGVMGERLNDIEFAQIVRSTPLISVDLILRDPDGKVLVGLRTNEPAKGFYFVPGGIILKNETIAAAFARILHSELGCQVSFEKARFVGIFEHFYSANRFANPEFGTHYVALAYEVLLTCRPEIVLDTQHCAIRWIDEHELHEAIDVHPYTKAYF
jgi:colanic acid biosynthesis protein WcaH